MDITLSITCNLATADKIIQLLNPKPKPPPAIIPEELQDWTAEMRCGIDGLGLSHTIRRNLMRATAIETRESKWDPATDKWVRMPCEPHPRASYAFKHHIRANLLRFDEWIRAVAGRPFGRSSLLGRAPGIGPKRYAILRAAAKAWVQKQGETES